MLERVRRHLAATPRVADVETWTAWPNGQWSLALRVGLSVAESPHMPAQTQWQLVIGVDPTVTVHFYPGLEGGLEFTHAHQDYNGEIVTDRPWRSGKPCLEVPFTHVARREWDNEPSDLDERVGWKLHRLFAWIDAAAIGTLRAPGDRFELPAVKGIFPPPPLIAFKEAADAAGRWFAQPRRLGIAKVAKLPGANKVRYVQSFHSLGDEPVHAVAWGHALSEPRESDDCLWVLLGQIPVFAPWQLPHTWAQLAELLRHQGVDMERALAAFGAYLRRKSLPTKGRWLLVGFPVSDRIGDPPTRLHWMAVEGINLTSRSESRRGFRANEDNHRAWDREVARSNAELGWRATANWATDQLRTRGQAEQALREKKVLVIGAGALGSAVANNLLRLGVLNLGIVDHDILKAGNLSRHVLGLVELGHNKAKALAIRLNASAPDSEVLAFPENLVSPSAIPTALLDYDVIVDCTASDAVLSYLSRVEWGRPKIFVSLSMTWNGAGLLAYSSHGSVFPALDALAKLSQAPRPPDEFDQDYPEGVGCWSPVFPVGMDDVQMWGGIGTRFIRLAAASPGERFSYFVVGPEGTVEKRS